MNNKYKKLYGSGDPNEDGKIIENIIENIKKYIKNPNMKSIDIIKNICIDYNNQKNYIEKNNLYKKLYRKIAVIIHPDKCKEEDNVKCKEIFQLVQEYLNLENDAKSNKCNVLIDTPNTPYQYESYNSNKPDKNKSYNPEYLNLQNYYYKTVNKYVELKPKFIHILSTFDINKKLNDAKNILLYIQNKPDDNSVNKLYDLLDEINNLLNDIKNKQSQPTQPPRQSPPYQPPPRQSPPYQPPPRQSPPNQPPPRQSRPYQPPPRQSPPNQPPPRQSRPTQQSQQYNIHSDCYDLLNYYEEIKNLYYMISKLFTPKQTIYFEKYLLHSYTQISIYCDDPSNIKLLNEIYALLNKLNNELIPLYEKNKNSSNQNSFNQNSSNQNSYNYNNNYESDLIYYNITVTRFNKLSINKYSIMIEILNELNEIKNIFLHTPSDRYDINNSNNILTKLNKINKELDKL